MMKRRGFLTSLAAGGGLFAAFPGIIGCSSENNQKKEIYHSDFEEYSIVKLQKIFNSGKINSENLVKHYKQRISEIDRLGPGINAIAELNPDAEEIAKKLDLERAQGTIRGPMHGIPVLIKDNIDTGDDMQTTAGSLALSGFKANEDAFIVKKLRESGAVLLGKTNLSEWANFRSTNSSSGWSARGGQVKNPYVLDRSPCGSSSGSAAAVTANLCTIAIGTETDGSIVCPSGVNGIVGIKPTLGLWSRSGIIPIAFSQDTAGPMARSVEDAAILLSALTGIDNNDSETVNSNPHLGINYQDSLDLNGLQGSRIGIVRNLFGFNNEVDIIIENAIAEMKNSGAEIIDNLEFDPEDKIGDHEWTILLYEFKHSLNKYFKEHPNSPIESLEELIKYNKDQHKLEMPWFKQEIFEMAQKKGDLNELEYISAVNKAKKLSGEKGIDKLINDNKLDALIAPTNGPAWKIDFVNGDTYAGGSSSAAAVSGYPSITVPAGHIHNLPVGVSFIGKAWSEATLIKLAYSFEQKTLHRKTPEFISSIEG